jgi:hypothetical protein
MPGRRPMGTTILVALGRGAPGSVAVARLHTVVTVGGCRTAELVWVLGHRVLAVTLLGVTLLGVTLLGVTLLAVTVLPVTLLPVTLLAVTLLGVTVLPVTVLPVALILGCETVAGMRAADVVGRRLAGAFGRLGGC